MLCEENAFILPNPASVDDPTFKTGRERDRFLPRHLSALSDGLGQETDITRTTRMLLYCCRTGLYNNMQPAKQPLKPGAF